MRSKKSLYGDEKYIVDEKLDSTEKFVCLGVEDIDQKKESEDTRGLLM